MTKIPQYFNLTLTLLEEQTLVSIRSGALTEPERKEFWLAQAGEWAQRALNEIASHLQAMAHMGQAIAKPDARTFELPKLCKFFANSADSGRWPEFMALVECSIARLGLPE